MLNRFMGRHVTVVTAHDTFEGRFIDYATNSDGALLYVAVELEHGFTFIFDSLVCIEIDKETYNATS